MTTTDQAIRHNHITRDIKPAGQCPACDQYNDKPAANKQETRPVAGKSCTLNMELVDKDDDTVEKIEIQISGYTTSRGVIRALYNLGQEGYLANLYQALEGNGVEDDD